MEIARFGVRAKRNHDFSISFFPEGLLRSGSDLQHLRWSSYTDLNRVTLDSSLLICHASLKLVKKVQLAKGPSQLTFDEIGGSARPFALLLVAHISEVNGRTFGSSVHMLVPIGTHFLEPLELRLGISIGHALKFR